MSPAQEGVKSEVSQREKVHLPCKEDGSGREEVIHIVF